MPASEKRRAPRGRTGGQSQEAQNFTRESSVAVGFGKVPHQLTRGEAIDRRSRVAAIAVYALLASYANPDGRAWPSTRTLADQLGIGRNTVKAALDALEAAGFIEREERFVGATGEHASTMYTLLGGSERDPRGSEPDPPVGPSQTQGGSERDPEEEPDNKNQENENHFDLWWVAYPKKVDEADARAAWRELEAKDRLPEIDLLMRATERYLADLSSPRWLKKPAVFLRQTVFSQWLLEPRAPLYQRPVSDDGLPTSPAEVRQAKNLAVVARAAELDRQDIGLQNLGHRPAAIVIHELDSGDEAW